jgi:hypothetical protein
MEERERNKGKRKNSGQREEWRREKGMEKRERNGEQRKQLYLDRSLI